MFWTIKLYLHSNRFIGLVGRVFTNGPGDLGSILGHVIPKTLKMVLDTSLLNIQQYKVRIKGKGRSLKKSSSHLCYVFLINWSMFSDLVECLPMVREARVQSQVKSYPRLKNKKWYLMLPCLILSIIRYGSRVKWSNSGKGVAPSPRPRCSSDWKGSLRVTLDYGYQLYFYFTFQLHAYAKLNCLKWNCIDIETLLTLNRIDIYRTVLTVNCV